MADTRELTGAEVLDAIGPAFAADVPAFETALAHRRTALRHGDLPRWREAIAALPRADADRIELDADAPSATLDDIDAAALTAALRGLSPWRKGPWRIGPVEIDSEWRSDLKWHRLAAHIADPAGRRVLDVGGGNGYFSLRLAGRGAAAVLNVDPTLLFFCQFRAVQHYLAAANAAMLPVPLEALPVAQPFDTVMSMGVLYHRRSPIHHLSRLRAQLRPGGELVLETLVIDDPDDRVLVPEGRYARMRNVWFLPSLTLLGTWLERSGFDNVRVVDVSPTTPAEQRATEWMPFESLAAALDPGDPTRTVEGHPAPLRAVVLAERRG